MNEENKSKLSTSTIFGFLEFFFELFEDFWSKKKKRTEILKTLIVKIKRKRNFWRKKIKKKFFLGSHYQGSPKGQEP